MTSPRSLRMRLLLGALVFSAGALSAAVAVSFLLFWYHLVVAGHAEELGSVALTRTFVLLLCVLAALLLATGAFVVRTGLKPLEGLRAKLASIRDGSEKKLFGAFPTEVQPLVDDLNALLEHNEKAVNRAQTQAGNLAHGLKTPIAVLVNEAARLAADGQADLAKTIDQQARLMLRHVDYHMARARAVASGRLRGARCPIAPIVERLGRVMDRVHVGRDVRIDVQIAEAHHFRGEGPDLEEMLGNLLDNACKWAGSHVEVRSSCEGEAVLVTVDDDGPGLPEEARERALERGARLDEAMTGSGLGLAIVRDLAELYGGSIALADSPLGGLRTVLRLPAA